jgi:hypothetical protein
VAGIKGYIFMRIFYLLLALPLMTNADTKTLDKYLPADELVTYLDSHDPSELSVKLSTGEIIRATHRKVEHEILWGWEDDENDKKLYLNYSSVDGLVLKDPDSEVIIQLEGVVDEHPLEKAMHNCFDENRSNMGVKYCYYLAYNSWDLELNRLYAELGGSKNESLNSMQISWIKYRDNLLDV